MTQEQFDVTVEWARLVRDRAAPYGLLERQLAVALLEEHDRAERLAKEYRRAVDELAEMTKRAEHMTGPGSPAARMEFPAGPPEGWNWGLDGPVDDTLAQDAARYRELRENIGIGQEINGSAWWMESRVYLGPAPVDLDAAADRLIAEQEASHG